MFSAFGVDPSLLVARFNESLALMRALWTEPEVDFDGRFWQLHGAAMEPKPFQKPGPPIWFGASHPDALRRAVRSADGFFGAGSQTTAQFADQVQIVREELDRQGRDPASFTWPSGSTWLWTTMQRAARGLVSDGLQRLYRSFGLPDLTPVAVYGPPAACVEGLQAVADAGAELLLLNPLSHEADQMERLAAEVVPHLR